MIELKGASVADTAAEVVREKHITQVIFGRSIERGWKKFLYVSAAHRFLRESPEVDVHIVTQEKTESPIGMKFAAGNYDAGAVLPLTINSGSTTMLLGYSEFFGALMRRTRVSAAVIPISRRGWRMVVRPGF